MKALLIGWGFVLLAWVVDLGLWIVHASDPTRANSLVWLIALPAIPGLILVGIGAVKIVREKP